MNSPPDLIDTTFSPCPFCGRGELSVIGVEMLHTVPQCAGFMRIDTLGELADELARVRRAGFPHGKPTVTGPGARLDRWRN